MEHVQAYLGILRFEILNDGRRLRRLRKVVRLERLMELITILLERVDVNPSSFRCRQPDAKFSPPFRMCIKAKEQRTPGE